MRPNIIRAMLAGLLTVSCGAFAQSTNATLFGVVLDAQGAVVPHAEVVAIDTQTGQSHGTTSGENGNYAITDLPIGEYKITASANGFKLW
jgi:Carboxypeptidase regulatory-like domain